MQVAPRVAAAAEARPPAAAELPLAPTAEAIVNHPLVKKAAELFGDRKK